MGSLIQRLKKRAIKPVMKLAVTWTGMTVSSLSQASFAASARDTQRFTAATKTLTLQVGQTPIQDEQSSTELVFEAAQLRGKVLRSIIVVVAVDLALAYFY